MLTLVLSLIILVSILLVLVVLAQNSKGGGLSSQFGGAGASQMMGVKKTGDFLERLTWGFAITMFVLCISTAFILDTGASEDGLRSPNVDRARESGQGMGLPGAGEQQQIPIDMDDEEEGAQQELNLEDLIDDNDE